MSNTATIQTILAARSGNPFVCGTCYDTATIDQGGAEVACPDCDPITVKVTGLSHGMGFKGAEYWTAEAFTSTTITFRASRKAILRNIAEVRKAAVLQAHGMGLRGRNYISSGPKSIETHVLAAI